MGKVITLTSQNFSQEVLRSKLPVLVDFWAPWCMPCRMVSPVVETLSNVYAGKIKVGKLNVDENQDIANKFNTMSIPVIIVFKKGKVFRKHVGAASRKIMEDFIREAI